MDSTIKTATLKEQRPLTTFAKRTETKWIRPIVFGLLSLLLIPLSSCKQNKWAEWKIQNQLWLENNKSREGVKISSSGLQYKIIADPLADYGEARPNLTGTIVCDYTAKLINGYQVDAGNDVTLSLASTIAGFAEGCHKIHSQGDIELYVPAYLGYDKTKYDSNDYSTAEGAGTEGTQSYIPPYSTLIYNIHICAIVSN